MSNKGLDSPKAITSDKAAKLKAAGYGFVARYTFHTSGFKDLLTRPEAITISKAGLYVVTVWESGYPTKGNYFTTQQGEADAQASHMRSQDAGQPAGTPIFHAVDFDAAASEVYDHFRAIRRFSKAQGRYLVGAYGDGEVIRKLKELGLIDVGWLAQSRGWRGYEQGKPVADIVQGRECEVLGIDVDLDTSTGRGGGWQICC